MLPLRMLFCILCIISGSASRVVLNNNTDQDTKIIHSDGNEIHCYCNLASCITSSYMCKTEKNESGCFKRFDRISQQFLYGCIDSLVRQTVCPKDAETSSESSDPSNPNQCCYTDMCNHETVADNTVISYSEIHLEEPNEEEIKKMLTLKEVTQNLPSRYYTNSEIWKRAFMIAVPICGLMILLILIFIALKILKSDLPEDRNNSSKLLKENCEVAAVSNNVLMQTSMFDKRQNNSQKLWPRNFLFMFNKCNKNNGNTKNAGYHFVLDDKSLSLNNLRNCPAPRVSEKFSRQNLNILRLPHKFRELKQKNCNKSSNGQQNSIIHINNNQRISHTYPVTFDAHFGDFKRYNFPQ